MTGKVTGRLKPCGHRSICVGCYEEYVNEGRGVNCPQCFSDVKSFYLMMKIPPIPIMKCMAGGDVYASRYWTPG